MPERNRCNGCYFWCPVKVIHLAGEHRQPYGRCNLGGQENYEIVFPWYHQGCEDWQNKFRSTGIQGTSPPLSIAETEQVWVEYRKQVALCNVDTEPAQSRWGCYHPEQGWSLRSDGSEFIATSREEAGKELIKFTWTTGWGVKAYLGVHETCPNCGHAL